MNLTYIFKHRSYFESPCSNRVNTLPQIISPASFPPTPPLIHVAVATLTPRDSLKASREHLHPPLPLPRFPAQTMWLMASPLSSLAQISPPLTALFKIALHPTPHPSLSVLLILCSGSSSSMPYELLIY